jgi:hypothetical protein
VEPVNSAQYVEAAERALMVFQAISLITAVTSMSLQQLRAII